MHKRWIGFLVGLILTTGLCLTTGQAVFQDTASHWAGEQVARWATAGIVQGYDGSFRPDDTITRGEVATVLDRLLHTEVVSAQSFSDLPQGAFYTEPVLRLNQAGVILGYPDGTIRPTAPITRQDAMVMLQRALRVRADGTGELSFADAGEVASYALEAVAAFADKGYMQGRPGGLIAPEHPITRAEFVTLLDNMIAAVYPTEQAQLETGDILLVNEPGVTVSGQTADTVLIAQGVGEGTVVLENVIADRVEVLGGGTESVIIRGDSQIRSIYVARQDGAVRVLVEGNAKVEVTYIDDGCNEVILSGSFQAVQIGSEDAQVQLIDAKVQTVTITGNGAHLLIDKNSKVDALVVGETVTNANVDSEGSVGTVHVENPSADIKVPGMDSGGGSGGSSGGTGTIIPDPGPEPEPEPEDRWIFDVLFLVAGKGSILAEVVEEEIPDPDPPRPIDPERDGYLLTIDTGSNGFVIAEEYIPPVDPEPEPEEYILTITIDGKGIIIVEEGE